MADGKYGPHAPDKTYIPHAYREQLFDTGEVTLNYSVAGSDQQPALVLIPGQTESWWGYEAAMDLLKEHFQIYAVDLRGQGRSSRTPGRYTLDNVGEDVARFISFRIRRPVVVADCHLVASSRLASLPTHRRAHYAVPIMRTRLCSSRLLQSAAPACARVSWPGCWI